MAEDGVNGSGTTCAGCGMSNPVSMRFCGNCGKPLTAPVAVAAAAPVTPPPIPAPLPAVVTETPAVVAAAPLSPPSEPPPPLPTPPLVTIDIPADPVARERERDRLLTLANVQRMRGQVSDARQTLQNAIALSEGSVPQMVAPTHELLGDMLAAEGRIEEASEAYKQATDADPKRVSAEKKFAQMTLALAEAKGTLNISEAMLRGDSLADLMASGAMGRQQGKKNAGVAMLLSLLMPGFGQIYNGQVIKGVVVMGVFLVLLLLITLAPGGSEFLNQFAAIMALKPNTPSRAPIPGWLPIVGIMVVAVWLYGIVDAPFMAGKGTVTDPDRPPVDKSGWEV